MGASLTCGGRTRQNTRMLPLSSRMVLCSLRLAVRQFGNAVDAKNSWAKQLSPPATPTSCTVPCLPHRLVLLCPRPRLLQVLLARGQGAMLMSQSLACLGVWWSHNRICVRVRGCGILLLMFCAGNFFRAANKPSQICDGGVTRGNGVRLLT